MKKYAIINDTGKILAVSVLLDAPIGVNAIEIPADSSVMPQTHYFDGTNFIELPIKPTVFHVFDYETKQWQDLRTLEIQWSIIRTQRDQLLKNSDWTQLPDVTLATKKVWAAYRQLLRDITLQSDPFNITWPTPPGA